jgi:hypothetical protein
VTPLPEPPSEASTARSVLNEIGIEFNSLSETDPIQAWKMYRRRLMENFGLLSEVMSPKDITELCMKIDENVRGKSTAEMGSPLQRLEEFLSGSKVH